MTPSFFDDRMQTLAIERPIDPANPLLRNGITPAVGAATRDRDRTPGVGGHRLRRYGLEWNWRTILPNHKIAPTSMSNARRW